MITSTDRNQMVASNVTKSVKLALEQEAQKKQISKSLLMHRLLLEGLLSRGYPVKDEVSTDG